MPDFSGAVPLGVPQPEGEPEGNYKSPELAKLGAKVDNLRQKNIRSERELAAFGAQIPAWEFLKLRFQLFLDMVWPGDTPETQQLRLQHDLAFQEAVASQWGQLKSAVVQAQLSAGAQVPQEMLDAMQPPAGLRKRS